MLLLERCKTGSSSLRENRNVTSETEIITPVSYLKTNTKLLQEASCYMSYSVCFAQYYKIVSVFLVKWNKPRNRHCTVYSNSAHSQKGGKIKKKFKTRNRSHLPITICHSEGEYCSWRESRVNCFIIILERMWILNLDRV